MNDPWLARDAAQSGGHAVRADAGTAQAHRRSGRSSDRSRSGRPISTSRTATRSRASCWSATRSRRRVRPPAPAPARCSPTSSACATCTYRAGSRPTGWASTRSRAFYDDPVKHACDRHSYRQGVQSAFGVDRCLDCHGVSRPLDALPRPIRHRQDAAGACLAFGCGTGAAGRAHCRRSIDRADRAFHAAGGAAPAEDVQQRRNAAAEQRSRSVRLRHSFDRECRDEIMHGECFWSRSALLRHRCGFMRSRNRHRITTGASRSA